MYLSKQEQYDKICKEAERFWDRSSQMEENPVTHVLVGFTKTLETGELGNYLNDELYENVMNALINLNSGIDLRDSSKIMNNCQNLIKAIQHFPSVRAMLNK